MPYRARVSKVGFWVSETTTLMPPLVPLSSVAVMMALPTAWAVTTPFSSTVAMVSSALLQEATVRPLSV